MEGTPRTAIAILGVLLLMLIGARLVVGRTGLFSGSTEQMDHKATSEAAPAPRATTQPFDTAAVTWTETATFALG